MSKIDAECLKTLGEAIALCQVLEKENKELEAIARESIQKAQELVEKTRKLYRIDRELLLAPSMN